MGNTCWLGTPGGQIVSSHPLKSMGSRHINANNGVVQVMYKFRPDQRGFEHGEQDGRLLWDLTMQALPALVNLVH